MQVRLLKIHTHEGRDCNAGEVIDLEASLAEWLIELGVAEPLQSVKKRKEQEE